MTLSVSSSTTSSRDDWTREINHQIAGSNQRSARNPSSPTRPSPVAPSHVPQLVHEGGVLHRFGQMRADGRGQQDDGVTKAERHGLPDVIDVTNVDPAGRAFQGASDPSDLLAPARHDAQAPKINESGRQPQQPQPRCQGERDDDHVRDGGSEAETTKQDADGPEPIRPQMARSRSILPLSMAIDVRNVSRCHGCISGNARQTPARPPPRVPHRRGIDGEPSGGEGRRRHHERDLKAPAEKVAQQDASITPPCRP